MTTGYHLLDHRNPNAPDRGDGRSLGWHVKLCTSTS